MATAVKVGFEPRLNHAFHDIFPDEVGGDAHHVGVVVVAANFSIDNVPAVGGANAVDFVRGDAHAVAGGADQHAAFDFVAGHVFGHENGVIGVVHTDGGVRAEVKDLVP